MKIPPEFTIPAPLFIFAVLVLAVLLVVLVASIFRMRGGAPQRTRVTPAPLPSLPDDPEEIGPIQKPGRLGLFSLGAVVTVAACLVSLLLIPWPWNVSLVIVTWFYLGIGGLTKVEVGFRGVPVIFGGRFMRLDRYCREVRETLPDGTTATRQEVISLARSRFELPEGWNWILPPPLMGREPVEVREQSVVVPPFTVISRNNIRITVAQSVIRYRTVNPAQFLSVAKRVIEKSLLELVQQRLRVGLRGMNDEDAVGASDTLRNDVQHEADQRAFAWGIDVIEVLIGEIARPPEVQADYEKIVRERKQQEAERTEIENVRELIGVLTPLIPADMAAEIVQAEREKGTRAVDVKRIILAPEAIQALGAILGRRT